MRDGKKTNSPRVLDTNKANEIIVIIGSIL